MSFLLILLLPLIDPSLPRKVGTLQKPSCLPSEEVSGHLRRLRLFKLRASCYAVKHATSHPRQQFFVADGSRGLRSGKVTKIGRLQTSSIHWSTPRCFNRLAIMTSLGIFEHPPSLDKIETAPLSDCNGTNWRKLLRILLISKHQIISTVPYLNFLTKCSPCDATMCAHSFSPPGATP